VLGAFVATAAWVGGMLWVGAAAAGEQAARRIENNVITIRAVFFTVCPFVMYLYKEYQNLYLKSRDCIYVTLDMNLNFLD